MERFNQLEIDVLYFLGIGNVFHSLLPSGDVTSSSVLLKSGIFSRLKQNQHYARAVKVIIFIETMMATLSSVLEL